MNVKLTTSEIAVFLQFRQLEDALAKTMRNQMFRAIKAGRKIDKDLKLRVSIDDASDPLYGALIDASTGVPIDDGKPDPNAKAYYKLPVDEARRLLTKYGYLLVDNDKRGEGSMDVDSEFVYFESLR